MREATQGSRWKSSDLWETLEQMVRGRVQEFIQEILEDEVTEFLGGRAKLQRMPTVSLTPPSPIRLLRVPQTAIVFPLVASRPLVLILIVATFSS